MQQSTPAWEVTALVLIGAIGLFLAVTALLTLNGAAISGAAVFLAVPAFLYFAWLVWFLVRQSRRG